MVNQLPLMCEGIVNRLFSTLSINLDRVNESSELAMKPDKKFLLSCRSAFIDNLVHKESKPYFIRFQYTGSSVVIVCGCVRKTQILILVDA